jgi:phosphomannomutase
MDHVGEYEIESIRDLGEPGFDSLSLDHKPTLPTSASSPMMTFRFKNGTVAQFRASGTEPKLKYYIEMRGQPGVDRDTVVQNLRLMSKILIEALLKPEENGLIAPS